MADQNIQTSLVSWKSVFAGLFVALLAYGALFFLGIGVGGITLANVVQSGGATIFGVSTGLWIVLSTILSLLAGGYLAARVSSYVTPRVGAAQGLVIAGIFFSIMFAEMAITAGLAGLGLTAVTGVAAAQASQSAMLTSAVETVIEDSQLKSDLHVVAKEVTARVLRGDTESAKKYLRSQIQSGDLDSKMAKIQDRVKEAGVNTAKAVSGLGWMTFITFCLGALGAAWGGSMGTRNNVRKPLDTEEVVHLRKVQST